MGLVGALQSLRSFRRRLPWALGSPELIYRGPHEAGIHDHLRTKR